ncbi:MAG: HEAT repeat domain-containing protein [Blastocatellia bacterium]
MAIDLCNKQEHIRISDDSATLEGRFGEALNDVSVPLDALSVDQREVVELAYYSALNHPNPLMHVVGDPAAWESYFGHALDRVAVRLDPRANSELRHQARNHPDPVMREQALYEYTDRNNDDAIELLCEAVQHDRDRQVRWDALWAIEKMGGIKAVQALRKFQKDADPEIAEWASLFIGELQTGAPSFDGRECRYTPGRTFDETIFLLIHCDLYIRLDNTNQHWGKLSLAPQGLARVYGQAHACPNVETRERQLVIAKQISGLHADGSLHVDNYLFRGFTERTQIDRGNFYFESHVKRPFYVSGKADDPSMGVQDSHIGFMREGCWYLDNRFKIRGSDAIRYVRGRFQGWGYTNLQRIAGKPLDEILEPGNGILSTLHNPVAGPLTNVFIAGTFKGKLNDWDGDGNIDLNSRSVYSTTEGEVDSNMDGIPDSPGVACCPGVNGGLL